MPGDPAIRLLTPHDARNTSEAESAFAAVPDSMRAELLNGVVCMAPAPAPIHQVLVQRLGGRRLLKYDSRDGGPSDPKGWVFVPDAEVDLGGRPDRFRPDLAGWRESCATFSLHDPTITVAPDWVCEVLSPSTETIDRGTKAPLYASHGIEWLWLIDPVTKCVEVFHNEKGTSRPVQTFCEHDLGGLPPFDFALLDGFFAI